MKCAVQHSLWGKEKIERKLKKMKHVMNFARNCVSLIANKKDGICWRIGLNTLLFLGIANTFFSII